MSNEVKRLMGIKAALVSTTNTSGWAYIKGMADNVVTIAVQTAIDEEDDNKATSLRYKAKALKDGFRDLFNAIEATKQVGTDTEPEWFTQLSYQEEVEVDN